MDRRHGLAFPGDGGLLLDRDALLEVGGGEVALLVAKDGHRARLARLGERYIGDVDARGVVLEGALGLVGGLDLEALGASGEGSLDFAALVVLDVDGNVGVVDLRARDVEEAEAESRLAGLEDAARREGDDLVRLPHFRDEFVDCAGAGFGEVGGFGRRGCRLARVRRLVVLAAAGGEGGEGEQRRRCRFGVRRSRATILEMVSKSHRKELERRRCRRRVDRVPATRVMRRGILRRKE